MKSIIVIGILIGSLVLLRIISFSNQIVVLPKEEIVLQATIVSEPKVGARYQTFQIASAYKRSITVKTAPFPTYFYGQKIGIKGKVTEHIFISGNKQLQINYPQIAISEQMHANIFLRGRTYVISFFEQYLSPIHASLLLGIVFGIKRGIPEEFADALSQVGVFHVIAASGMNVSMIAGALLPVFILFFKRQYAIVLTALVLVLYAYIAGFEPSIVRATIMALIAFTGQILGRQRSGMIALLLTAFIMLLVDPSNVADIGFQLSFMATAGILLISPHLSLRKKLSKNDNKQDITKLFAADLKTTLAAQIATLPLLFIHFGRFNLLSVFINLLILWTIPILMIIGSTAGLLSLLFPFLARFILYLSLPFLFYFEKTVSIFAFLPGTFSVTELPLAVWIGYYLLLISFLSHSWKKQQ